MPKHDATPRWVERVHDTDRAIADSMGRVGVPALRLGMGVVFIWFGLLKVVGKSPASGLVERTTSWAFDPAWFVPTLGWWEALIGVCLIDPVRLLGGGSWLTRAGLFLLALQMPGTFLPLVMVPDVCFTDPPFGLTMEGQYIVKNLVIIAAALVVGGSVRRRAGVRPAGDTA